MGLVYSVIDQNFPPKAKWSVDQIPDLSSKVVIVTGGNSGLGKETVKALLAHNAKVYMASRDAHKAEIVIQELKGETGKEAIFLQLDLASLESVKSAAQEFQRQESQLHILFNNGGVMSPPIDKLTNDGYDLQFGTNVLGHFFLTTLLLPELKAGAKSSSDHVARVINTSSQVHVIAKLDFDALADTAARNKLTPSDLYGQSKFGNVVFSHELARRYGDDGIVSIALHPGSLKTDLGRHISPFVRSIIHALSNTPAQGALTQLWGGTAPEAASLNGKYLIPWARIGLPHKDTLDPTTGAKLWEWLEEQVKGH